MFFDKLERSVSCSQNAMDVLVWLVMDLYGSFVDVYFSNSQTLLQVFRCVLKSSNLSEQVRPWQYSKMVKPLKLKQTLVLVNMSNVL